MDIDITPALERINEMATNFIASLPNLVLAIIVFVLFFLLAKGIQLLVRRVAIRSGLGVGAGLVFGRLVQWGTVLAGLVIAASVVFPSLQAGNIVELLGITSIAIGFAFRDVAQNFLAGILLLLTRPFRIGDQIIVSGFEGTVEDIQTRATFIRMYDGRRVVIPNANLFIESVIVNTAAPTRRSQYDFGISYEADLEQARRLVLRAISTVEDVLPDPPPDTLVVQLGESTVNVRARWWTDSRRREVIAVQDRVIAAIKRELEDNGIDMPYPTQKVLLHDETSSGRAHRPALAP
ncbi:MAG TPA: mechanosensitive ion channel [Anaerolineales bacterium]|jgi:small-conductance mechanosensitive channel|nr:mechanosensitive ion channel [Anaerolineales bacterium]